MKNEPERIAVISDIHGNYPALVSVAEDAEKYGVNQYIFIGDYIFDLPFSNEVARFLMGLENAYIIKGNKENYLNWFASDDQRNWTYDQMGGMYQAFRELAPDVFNFLNDLEDERYIKITPDITVYAAHIPAFFKTLPKDKSQSKTYHKKMLDKPFTHNKYLSEFGEAVNTDECKTVIKKIDADVILFGHNHLQAHAYCGDKLIVNSGSCGQPLDFNNEAAYTILEITDGRLNVIERRVNYDVEYSIRKLRGSAIYEKGRMWSELVCLALRTGRDYFGIFFEIAGRIKSAKGEEGMFFSNPTWEEATEIFTEEYKGVL